MSGKAKHKEKIGPGDAQEGINSSGQANQSASRAENPPQPATLDWLQTLTGGDNSKLQRWEWLFIGFILLTGGFLRFWRVGVPAMWGDESGSVQLALRSLHEILTSQVDVFPPVHLVLMHYSLMLFGNNEWAARLPCVVAGTAAIPVQYLLTRLLVGRRVALISGLFVSFCMYPVYYSRDAHSYGVYAFFGWLAGYYFCKIIYSDGRRRGDWVGYAIASVLMVLTHFIGAVACLEQALVGGALIAVRIWKKYPWVPTKRLILGFGGAAIVVAIGLACYSPILFAITAGKYMGTPESQLLKITPELIYNTLTTQGFGNGLGVYLFGSLLLAGLIYAFIQSRLLAAVMLLYIVFPYIFFATMVFGHFVVVRYFMYTYPLVVIFACCGAWAIISGCLRLFKGKLIVYAAAMSILTLWAVQMIPAYVNFFNMTGHDWPKKEMADWMRTNIPKGSTILYENYYELRWIGPSGYQVPDMNYVYLGIWGYEPEYKTLRMRDRYQAFLEKYPEAYFFFNDGFKQSLGYWRWPRNFFARKEQFINKHGIMLSRRGLVFSDFCGDGEPSQKDLAKVSGFGSTLYYNTEQDLIAKAKGEQRPCIRRLIGGFSFWLNPENLIPWMVATNEGRIAVHQLVDGHRTIQLKTQAVAFGADRIDITGPTGQLGSWTMAEGKIQDYTLSISNVPAGKIELSLKVHNSGRNPSGRPAAVLFNNITVE